MGRKKKTINTTVNNKISYAGNITISLTKNNKIVKKDSYKNNGTNFLFNFLLSCIAGTFDRNGVPGYIRLFDKTDSETESTLDFSENTVLCQPIYIKEPSVVTTEDNEPITVISFRVPVAYLTRRDHIYKIALYNKLNKDISTNMMAYFLIKHNNIWDGYDISSLNTDYSLLIEWRMSVGNDA